MTADLAMTVAQLRGALDIAEDDDRVMIDDGGSLFVGAAAVVISTGVVTIRMGATS